MPGGLTFGSVISTTASGAVPSITYGLNQSTGSGHLEATVYQGNPTVVQNGTNFYSLGPIQLGGVYSRIRAQLNIASGGALSAAAQVQIMFKEGPNAPWYPGVSAAQLAALPSGVPSGDAPIYYTTDQSSFSPVSPSNTDISLDVRGVFAVDFQMSPNSNGAFTAQLFATAKAEA